MEINNALALAVRPPSVDLTTPLLTAARLKEAETSNALAQFQLQNAPALMAVQLEGARTQNALAGLNLSNATDRRNALAGYGQTGDINKLQSQPDLFQQVLANRTGMAAAARQKFDDTLLRNAKGAQRVASIADPAEQAAAWKEELDLAKKEGRIDEATYRREASQPVNALKLSNIMKLGLTIDQAITLEQKEKDRAAGAGAIKALGSVFEGGTPAAGNAPATPGAPGAANAPATSNEKRLVASESGGKPGLVNQLGYAGTYQFGAPRLADLGIYTPGEGEKIDTWSKSPVNAPGKWSGTFNVPGHPEVKTLQDFLSNPDAQQAAFRVHAAKTDLEIAQNGLDKFIGQTVGGVQITQDGLRNMIHLGGAAGTRKMLESGGKVNPADANGTTLLDYARLGAGGDTGKTSLQNFGSTLAGVPTGKMLPVLIQIAGMPGLPKATQDVATEMLKVSLANSKPTDDQREYFETYVPQELAAGRSPKLFNDWVIERKKATGTNVVQVNKGEDAYDKEMGGAFAKKYNALNDAGDKAFATLGTLQTMRRLSADPNLYSGALAENVALPIKRAMVALGGDEKSAASMEAFRALANKSVLDSMGGSLGSGFSNADRDFVVSQVPGLGNTKAGNEVLFGVMEKIERRKIDVARLAQEYAQEPGPDGKPRGRLDAGFDRKLSEWREKNPLFSTEERADIKKAATDNAGSAALPIFSNPDEARAKLQKGDRFRTPDGRTLEVP